MFFIYISIYLFIYLFILQKHNAWAKTIAEQIAAKCFLLVLQEYFSHFGNKFLR